MKAVWVIGKEAVSLSSGSVPLCLPDPCFWLWAKSLLVNPLCQFMLTSAHTAACQPANRALLQGAGLWTLSSFHCLHWRITKASFGLGPPAHCFPGTCPICQFFGLLSFLQQRGANRACHPLRIKTYILYWPVWLSFSRYTWSVAGTFSSSHPSDTRFHTAVGGVCGRGMLCYPMTCWIPWSNVLRSLGFCEGSFFCVSYERV